jgi:phosphate transport system protein
MRKAYHQQLAALREQLGDMCEAAGVAMQTATRALLLADLERAQRIIGGQHTLAQMRVVAEDAAFMLLALQAPVASDLRGVVAAIRVSADAERMGGLAVHVAKLVRRRHPKHVLPVQLNSYFAEMGCIAAALGYAAQEVLRTGDPDRARSINDEDDTMDRLHRQLFVELIDRDWKYGVAAAVDATLLGRFYERFADHAVDIANRVIFQATGALPGRPDFTARSTR